MGSVAPPVLPPLWLDLKSEIPKEKLNPTGWDKLSEQEKAIKGTFISFKALLNCDSRLTNNQILEIVANSVVETGYYKNIPAFNFGGVKIKEAETKRLTALNGKCPLWWQKEGHIASGDEPMCYYKAYSSPEHFFKEWLETYVPKPSTVALTYRYQKCGDLFWKNLRWFHALIEAGYKGKVTKQNPNPSIETHETIVNKVRIMMTQKLLGLTSDGMWGKASTKAFSKFQKDNRLLENGLLDEVGFNILVLNWIKAGKNV